MDSDRMKLGEWLQQTVSSDEAAVRSATAVLEEAESHEGFALNLIYLCQGGMAETYTLPAVAYLKNYIRSKWGNEEELSPKVRQEIRKAMIECLLRVDGPALKLLVEAFRILIVEDFRQDYQWSQLIPGLRLALETSNLMNTMSTSGVRTLNALMALRAVLKPFQYFARPTEAKEAVPQKLEIITTELLLPLNAFFHHLVTMALQHKDKLSADDMAVMLVICKSLHLTIKSYMPSSLLPHLGTWMNDLLALLSTATLDRPFNEEQQLPMLKIWKRILQICTSLLTRHRLHADKLMPNISSVAMEVVTRGSQAEELAPYQERVLSMAFDVLSNILETGQGWRLLQQHFVSLLETVIFPTLCMKSKDVEDWTEDEEEYLLKNLPADLDDISGWREDLFRPRRSALNLLGLIATSKGPPMADTSTKSTSSKRKKGGRTANGKKKVEVTAGEALVLPFLLQFSLPQDGTPPSGEANVKYYGALLAYGCLREFFSGQDPEKMAALLQTRVLPLYGFQAPSPFVLANANWLLGELNSCLPEEQCGAIFNALLKAVNTPSEGAVSWRPVRASAAGAISRLLQEDVKPPQWLPLLQGAVAWSRCDEEEDATTALELLEETVIAGGDEVAELVPAMMEPVVQEIARRLPPQADPWPAVVEAGFSALAAMAEAWTEAEPDPEEHDGQALANWQAKSATVSATVAGLLCQAWRVQPEEKESLEQEAAPAPSCLGPTSVLISTLLQQTTDERTAGQLHTELLLRTWADLIADWGDPEEDELEQVLGAVDQAVALQDRAPLEQFAVAPMPPPPLPPIPPRSPFEGMCAFLAATMEWPASCLRVHSVLHACVASPQGHQALPAAIARLVEAACHRLTVVPDGMLRRAEPLLLVIASCFLLDQQRTAGSLERELPRGEDNFGGKAVVRWGERLAKLTASESEAGSKSESGLKLTALALQDLVRYLASGKVANANEASGLAYNALVSAMEALLRLKSLREEEEMEEEDDEDEEEGDDEEEEEEEEREETEEEFLQRYAATAKRLEEGGEGGEEDEGWERQELALGHLAQQEETQAVIACLTEHGRAVFGQRHAPPELVARFSEAFPAAVSAFGTA